MSTPKTKRRTPHRPVAGKAGKKAGEGQDGGKAPPPPQKGKETMVALAKRWEVGKTTASLWKRQGAPVHDDELLGSWLVARKEIGPGPRAKIAAMAAEKRGEQAREPVWGGALTKPEGPAGEPAEVVPVVPGVRGAASALRRQEDEELASYERLQAALASGDGGAIKEARAGWLRTSESLRKFDLLIEESRRDAGELLPRAEWDRMARAQVFWFLHSINRAHDALCEKLVGMPDAVSVWRVLDADLINRFGEAFAFACRRESGLSLPPWAVKSVMDALAVPIESVPNPDAIAPSPPPPNS